MKFPERQEGRGYAGLQERSPAGWQLASKLGLHVKGGRYVALPCWVAGLGRPGLKDVLGSCPAGDMSPHTRRSLQSKAEDTEENQDEYMHKNIKHVQNLRT